ncbi:uncharacterized protein [Asterias amurensis]|uniref:uncharacterized protein n=1 Tax=Asterias amurensis TaxID=7602 RepID=UPI003AB7FCB0
MAQPPPYSAQGKPPQQAGYPPPVYGNQAPVTNVQVQHTNVVVQQNRSSGLERSLGSLFKSAEKVVNDASNTLVRESDRYANSPTLNLFSNGNILRLQARSNGGYLQILPTGALDTKGSPNDLAAHFVVVNIGYNQIILKSAIYPTCHIGNHGGHIVGNGNGDHSCKFRLHETMQGFITFESVNPVDHHIGVNADGSLKPSNVVRKDNSAMFAPSLVSSPYPQPVHVQQTTTTTTTYQKK